MARLADLVAASGLGEAGAPSLTELGALLERLARQPVAGVNVHARPEGLRPAWIAEQAIEPVGFGALEDPVSQVAMLGAPGLLRGMKTLAEVAGTPGPRLGGLLARERGNLGPVPRGQGGEPLPGSQVRTPEGKLQRLYHGTNRVYPDFEASKFSSGAGGDLYGPGIYMTENPAIAKDYATMYWHPEAKDALRYIEGLAESQQYYMTQATKARSLDEAMGYMQQAAEYDGLMKQAEQRLQRWVTGYEHLYESPANIRPVYADVKKPFDIEAAAERRLVQKLDELDWDYSVKPDGTPDIPTNKELYQVLLRNLGDKAEVNDWLQANGYDGITHMGGAVTGGRPHRVYIAFSPEQVYPSVNVEAGGLP